MYGSKHRTTDGSYESRKDGSGYSNKREWNETNDEVSNHRKYIRTQSSSNTRIVPSSSSSQQQRQNGEKERKTVKDTKKPLRVFGDWSEFKSSTGKTYFYNCKTEISQWEKPKGWPTDEPSSRSSSSFISTDRIRKESTNVNISPSVRSRYKMDDFSQKPLQNGNLHSDKFNKLHQDNETSNNRLPSPADDSSRMSFSSTSSKESSAVNNIERNGSVLHSSLSESTIPVSIPVSDTPNKSFEKDSIVLNGNETKNPTIRSSIPPVTTTEQTIENEPSTPSISRAERDQEIHKYYRADLIQHLTDWPATQLEKQCLKLFDDYYGYSAKMSIGLIELKALKSNFRVLEIKRSILTQRLLRCEQHFKRREDDKLL